MKRHDIVPRINWQGEVESVGLIWHTAAGQPYWDESAYYSFTMPQIEELEEATSSLYQLFLEAGDYVIANDLMGRFGIPQQFHGAIRAAWENEPPALNYGRFDFGYDGVNPPKLFEFNCDTPTSLLEASVIQWFWKEQRFPQNDQFNSIHEQLLAQWKAIKPFLKNNIVYFAHIDDAAGEDSITVSYMRDVATEAGLRTEGVLMHDIGYDTFKRNFVDRFGFPMHVIQHLYPWEWLVNEANAPHILDSLDRTCWIEPIWKMIWSNKAILPILSEIAPDHPNLLFSTTSELDAANMPNFVKKPILAREGANIEIHRRDAETIKSADQEYGEEGYIFQELYELPKFGDRYPVIGSWIVDGSPAGMGIREDGLITGNTARFIPHIIV